jgi:uncharacterized protein (TIGR02186 family)
MKKIAILLTLLFLPNLNLQAQSIVSGISTNEINIDTKFNGQKILLFGAKGDAGNIVITVRGPKKKFTVTKKERLFGIWYNGKRIEFQDALSYYSIFSTLEGGKTTSALLEKLELGASNIKFKSSEKENKSEENEFTLQLIEKLEKEHLYSTGTSKIDFLDKTLFKVSLDFPKNIARGTYTVEIYLIDDDNLISFQSIPIYVNQVGVSAKISDYAHKQPMIYGLLAVILALTIGWCANYVFSRFMSK